MQAGLANQVAKPLVKISHYRTYIVTILITQEEAKNSLSLDGANDLPAGYGTAEEAPNVNFEPLHESRVGLHQDFLPGLFAPAAKRNQWILPLAVVGAAQEAIELFAHSHEHGPAKRNNIVLSVCT